MKANEVAVVKFLQAAKQFVIPIYQRTYTWTEDQCEQLWNDITRVAKSPDVRSHFIGSIVYIEENPSSTITDVSRLLVIDGQQRLTTLMLLLTAFAESLKDTNSDIKPGKIRSYFLFNNEESGDKRHKLILTKSDKETLIGILEGRQIQNAYSNLTINFRYFQNKLAESETDPDTLYLGIRKLSMVDIALDGNYDNPQLIFESLNSTGIDLGQADLIRNYVLMGLDKEMQEKIYENFWHPTEEDLTTSEDPEEFDWFMRDYLTIRTGKIPNIEDVYSNFKEYFTQVNSVEKLMKDIRYLSRFYRRIALEEDEPDVDIKQIIHDIKELKVGVAYPFMIESYADYNKGLISKDEIVEIFSIIESYAFRRAMCDIPTNSLNKTFANLTREIDKEQYVESFKAVLCTKIGYKRFPTDKEFSDRFVTKDVYNMPKIRKYLLRKLENQGRKEWAEVKNYTIEHIMPQNKNLSQEWRDALGQDWKEVHEKYLHTAGNLTLTGYNPDMSDKPFLEKRDMKGGFADSPLRLNRDLAQRDHWNGQAILERGKSLAQSSIEIWKYPHLPEEILQKYTKVEEEDGYDWREYSEDDYLEHNASDKTWKLYLKLKKRMLDIFPDFGVGIKKYYVGLYNDGWMICTITVQKTGLWVHYRPKNPVTYPLNSFVETYETEADEKIIGAVELVAGAGTVPVPQVPVTAEAWKEKNGKVSVRIYIADTHDLENALQIVQRTSKLDQS
ncbi:MAG: DUF262 domain-containing protein [Thaumarchaeota archaeon]|nr:DUF262 domain-containing protein [Nitrososphaerota archaeon]